MDKNPENLLLAIELENIYSIRDTVRIDFRAANIKTKQAKCYRTTFLSGTNRRF